MVAFIILATSFKDFFLDLRKKKLSDTAEKKSQNATVATLWGFKPGYGSGLLLSTYSNDKL